MMRPHILIYNYTTEPITWYTKGVPDNRSGIAAQYTHKDVTP